MSITPDLLARRLTLVAITSNLLRLDAPELSRRLNAEVPDLWPPEDWEPHVFDFLEKQFNNAPHTIGWNRYVILRSPSPILIGTMGGFPRTETEAEIGYSILEPWQNQGLATEGLRVLLREVFRSANVTAVSAQTIPHLVASVRILEKCGFTLVGPGEEEGTVRYRLERGSSWELGAGRRYVVASRFAGLTGC